MTNRKEEIQVRKNIILGVTVGHYIRTVSPVSSRLIAQESTLDLSPATIRNMLAELEEEGFLTHPHTSAGRVPTQKGYRYYVDHLMQQIQLLEDEKLRIKAEYERESLELELLMEKTTEVLSDVTNYTSIISIEGQEKVFLQGTNFVVDYPDYQDIKKIQDILVALDRKEQLLRIINRDLAKKMDILIGHELACAEIDSCSLVISKFHVKQTKGRIAILGPTRMNYGRVISALEYCSDLMEELI